jgi:septum formation protein
MFMPYTGSIIKKSINNKPLAALKVQLGAIRNEVYMKYILASGSPRRRELLARTGIKFEVIPSEMDEIITKEVPSDIVMELAYQKALNVYQKLDLSDCTVIGSDTIVVYKDEILGKPADKTEAYDMLSMLADRTHQVYTGVSLLVNIGGKLTAKTFFEKTDVTLYPISKEDLHAYVESGDPLDKAGAYGIQGDFAIHIKGINGDYNNVVGLPVGRLYQEMKALSLL